MREFPSYANNFASFRVYEAIYRTAQKEEEILLEFRGSANEEELVFTVIDNRPIRVGSIHELVHMLPELVSLSIDHSVRLVWNGEIKKVKLTEIFSHSQDPNHPQVASMQLRLVVDGKSYETTVCDTLTDAIWELRELTEKVAEWDLYACFNCEYAGHAQEYSNSDREFWCYRDVPEAIAGIHAGVKYANQKARFAGRYFVDAFHTCAAWQPRRWNVPSG